MSKATAFYNARLIDPATDYDGPGGLICEKGLITDCGADLSSAPSGDFDSVDCQGHVLAPGLIDMRVFVGEPGSEHKETLKSASESAAAGGVTTLIVMPDTDPVIDEAALVDFIERRARDTAIVNVHPMGALTKGMKGEAMTEMALLKEAGALAFTDPRRTIMNAQVMRRLLEYASGIDALVVLHTEDPNLAGPGCMNEGELSARLGLIGIPREAETLLVRRDLTLLDLTQTAGHFSQISCAASLSVIADAKAKNVPVTCAVSAQHLALNENDIATYRTFFKTQPPLRSEEDRLAMIEGLKDGTIDVVTSSHDPRGPEDKRLPFAEAAFGAVGLETLLPVLLELVHNDHISLVQALRAVTQRPAEILGLEAGRLAAGTPADLVLIDLNTPYKFDAETLKSKSKNSPYDGRLFQGKAIRTYVAGARVA
ncbi:MAG: dihydroorotase [Alphaproteobacteria bacterium]|nr:MAG: dihydroorotase [Alphaproteobacteria bacterium]